VPGRAQPGCAATRTAERPAGWAAEAPVPGGSVRRQRRCRKDQHGPAALPKRPVRRPAALPKRPAPAPAALPKRPAQRPAALPTRPARRRRGSLGPPASRHRVATAPASADPDAGQGEGDASADHLRRVAERKPYRVPPRGAQRQPDADLPRPARNGERNDAVPASESSSATLLKLTVRAASIRSVLRERRTCSSGVRKSVTGSAGSAVRRIVRMDWRDAAESSLDAHVKNCLPASKPPPGLSGWESRLVPAPRARRGD
jgi:hypothetical protein